jgi:hypothetical protein
MGGPVKLRGDDKGYCALNLRAMRTDCQWQAGLSITGTDFTGPAGFQVRRTTKGLNRPEREWDVRSLGGVVARSVESIRC